MRRELLVIAALVAAGCGTVTEPVIEPDWRLPDIPKPLTHADCVRLATHSAPTAAAWRARLFAAQAALRQAGKLPNPTFSAGWEDIGIGGSPVQQTFSLATELSAIFSKPRLEAAAQHDLDATRDDLLAERRKLAADVWRAYDDLVAARARAALAKESVAVAERVRAATERFVAAGDKSRFELDRADAEVAQARADEAKSQADARADELALAFAIGFARPVPLFLAEGLTPSADPTLVEVFLSDAATQRPEIAAAAERYRAQLERAHLTAERLQFLPAPSGGYRKTGSDTSYVASLDVQLPIFDSGAAADDAASAELLAAAANLRRVTRDVGDDVFAAHERADAADSFFADHARPMAERRRALREEAERLFAAGEIEHSDLVQSLRDEIDAHGALLDAELAAAKAHVDLAAATGRIDAADDKR
jgi:cobalt-zinc-cadmium efflux system outer membrane protein